jgi:hypothetical protein
VLIGYGLGSAESAGPVEVSSIGDLRLLLLLRFEGVGACGGG